MSTRRPLGRGHGCRRFPDSGVGAPFTPASLSGLRLWLDATQGVTFDGSNLVSAWADISGNGFDQAQGTGSAQPLRVAAGLNGLPIIRGDGGTDFMTGLGAVAGNPAHTLVVVAKYNTIVAANFRGLVAYGDTTTGAGSSTIGHESTGKWWYGGQNQVGALIGAAADTAWHVHIKTFNGTNVTGYLDGAVDLAATAGAFALTTGVEIFRHVTGSSPSSCDIAEVIFYGRALSAGEVAQVDAYLSAKWGI